MGDLLGNKQVAEVRAAYAYLRTRPDVDANRIGVAGNSFGGILAVFSAARLPGMRAVVASAPGSPDVGRGTGAARPPARRGTFDVFAWLRRWMGG